jgi:hypothetical protein
MVMDVMNAAIRLGELHGLFGTFERSGIRHRLSLFADDVVLFTKPIAEEAVAAVQILNAFGMASRLRCNLGKSSASPIRCANIDLQHVLSALSCPLKEFPMQYLGLRLSPARLSKTQLQPLVDKIAGHVPTWKAGIFERSGRLILINSTIAATHSITC